MANKDVRWIQRFNNFNKALNSLSKALIEFKEDTEEEVIKVGMIKFFEMTYELAWLTMKDYYEDQGEVGIQGSKDAIKLSFTRGLITNAEQWFEMVNSRKLSVHTYDEATANKVADDIATHYVDLFVQLQTRLQIEKLSS
ncbi:nucleotidyltransferase substrate binding protein [Pedobacter lithocola]|uniref:Nucleotidyltransferase substrate binding protein n=1 Tax=Pedobacter lithocola TaxID=1908239 RepID=A0ABV8PBV2_9SPHI